MATRLPRNDEIAEQLELLADLLELEGEASFRVVAYRRAATKVRETPTPVAQLAAEGRAKDLPGIGQTIEEKIVQVATDGEMHALTKRRQSVPEGVVAFLRLPGLGPKTARRIWKELGVTTLEALEDAAANKRLRGLTGLGAKTEENILKALSSRSSEPDNPGGMLLGKALPPLLAVVSVLRDHPAVDRVSEAGSARRRKELLRDLDIIATASEPAALTDYFCRLAWVQEVVAHGPTKAAVVSHDNLRFDLRVVPPESFGNLLQHFTGSKEHNLALREDAVRRGLSVSEYGITEVEGGEVMTMVDEQAVYERLGYAFIPPELREGQGELEAARAGALPALVEERDLLGDLHTHTDRSADGHNSLQEMAVAARGRGYEYLAVTDHSHYLGTEGLRAQEAEIEALNDVLRPFRLLRGIEVNIRANGSLDLPDEALERCDWVMASIHSGLRSDVTERVLAAMENPNVDCIGHLTGRKLNRRPPADIDVERVVAKALETGTFLEINSQPDRMDLRDTHARLTAEAGLRVTVSSDGHSVEALAFVEFGVAQARRAWLTRDQVLNTRPWREVERLLKS